MPSMPLKTQCSSLIKACYAGLICLIFQLWSVPGTANDEIWNDVRSGNAFVILRHALAPGNGDPDNFDLKQCETQRNLSTEGLQQAQRIGNAFKDFGVEGTELYSSQWCRCIDTANAMNMQLPEELPLLNSFYDDRKKGPAQMQGLLQWLKDRNSQKPLIMVSHQVVITALTGIYPSSGEAVIFKLKDNGEIEVIHELLIQ